MVRFRNPLNLVKADLRDDSKFTPGVRFTPQIAGTPNFREWNINTAINDGFKASSWVYSAVNKLSRTAASVEWRAYHLNEDGTQGDRWPDHPFELLMGDPNPYMNAQDFRERMYQHLWLAGNGLSKIVQVNNVPVGLVPIMPNAIKPVPSKSSFIAGYDLFEDSASTKSGHLENNEILHLMFVDPSNFYWGISPLQAVARTVDTDNEAVNWNKVSLQNRAVTDGVFSVGVPITKEEWEEIRSEVREQAQGSDNAHNPWVLGYGTTWNQLSLTPVEMDFLESRKNNRTEILAVYGVPPPMAGIYDEMQYNNVTTARLIWWLDTIIPFLDDVKIALKYSLGKRFGDDFVINYDLSNVEALKALQIEKISAAKDLWLMGVPLEMINTTLGLGLPNGIPGANVGYLPLTYYPVGEAPEPAPALPSGKSNLKKKSRGLETVEQRAQFFKAQDRTRLPWERKLKSLANTQLKSDYEALADAYEKDGEQGIRDLDLTIRVAWKQLTYKFVVTMFKEVGSAFYNELTGNNKAAPKPQPDNTTPPPEFEWYRSDFLDFLDTWTSYRAGKLVDSTLNNVLDMVAASASDGENIVDIAREIRDQVGTTTQRATLISRTEVVGYHNYAHDAAAKDSGVIDIKTWISSGDDRVRPTHQEVDGTDVAIDDSFNVGITQLAFPGDPSGDPNETIQCRCAVAYGQSSKGYFVRQMKTEIPESLVYLNGH